MTYLAKRRRLQDRHKGYWVASALLEEVASAWGKGLPTRIARKILRKRGIHPWSLLSQVPNSAWVRLAIELDVPRWVVDAVLDFEPVDWFGPVEGLGGFSFTDLPPGVVMPEGLVSFCLRVRDCEHLDRLPRRMWSNWILVVGCSRLSRLPSRPVGVESAWIFHCSSLREVPDSLAGVTELTVENCPSVVSIPSTPPGKHYIRHLSLESLPRLEIIRGRGPVGQLRIWNLPRLRTLGSMTVLDRLELHGCAELEVLPQCEEGVEGSLSDCPSLRASRPRTVAPSFRYEPYQGPSSLDGSVPIPGIQNVEPVLLIPEPQKAAYGPAWPWPAPSSVQPILNPGVVGVLKGTGFSPIEQVRFHLAQGLGVGPVVRDLLRFVGHPGKAVVLAASMLATALISGDDPLVRSILAQSEALELGCLSVILELDRSTMALLAPHVGEAFVKAIADYAGLGSYASAVGCLAGPLVLVRAFPDFEQLPLWKGMEGPLWSCPSLSIKDCPHLEHLPDLMVVEGDLEISRCPSLRCFPKALEVHGNLVVKGLPRLQRSLCRVRVVGSVQVECAPALKLISWDSWEV